MLLDYCCICRRGEEMADHLLLCCDFVSVLSLFVSIFDVYWVFRNSDPVLRLWAGVCNSKRRKVWEVAHLMFDVLYLEGE